MFKQKGGGGSKAFWTMLKKLHFSYTIASLTFGDRFYWYCSLNEKTVQDLKWVLVSLLYHRGYDKSPNVKNPNEQNG